MALIWFRLYERLGDATLLNAALKALDLVKDAQPLDNPAPGLRGGVPGSDPVWADYIYGALPNWAAKYLIDALLEKRRLLAGIDGRPREQAAALEPIAPPPPSRDRGVDRRPAVVLLAGPGGSKARRLLQAWQSWGFVPRAVVVERHPAPPALGRLRAQGS